jgi:hypothetical protein
MVLVREDSDRRGVEESGSRTKKERWIESSGWGGGLQSVESSTEFKRDREKDGHFTKVVAFESECVHEEE